MQGTWDAAVDPMDRSLSRLIRDALSASCPRCEAEAVALLRHAGSAGLEVGLPHRHSPRKGPSAIVSIRSGHSGHASVDSRTTPITAHLVGTTGATKVGRGKRAIPSG